MVLDGEIAATRKCPAVAILREGLFIPPFLAGYDGQSPDRWGKSAAFTEHSLARQKPGDQQRAVYLKAARRFPIAYSVSVLRWDASASLATRRRRCALPTIAFFPRIAFTCRSTSGPPGFAITDRSTCSARRIERALPSSRRRAFASRQPDASQRS
jgi:hypothetical protein